MTVFLFVSSPTSEINNDHSHRHYEEARRADDVIFRFEIASASSMMLPRNDHLIDFLKLIYELVTKYISVYYMLFHLFGKLISTVKLYLMKTELAS